MISIDAPITAVTVYPNRARITRIGTVHLESGEQTVLLSDLPPSIDERSVRAGGTGAGVKIIGVELRREFVADIPNESASDLQKQIEALRDRERSMTDDDAVDDDRLLFLAALRDSGADRLARGLASGTTTIESIGKLSDYIGGEMEGVQSRRRERNAALRELKREIDAVQQRMGGFGVQRREQRDIHVIVESAAPVDLQLEIVYMVGGASWRPLYDIRLLDDAVTLSYLATVEQQTGEEWPLTTLSLSTARPSFTSELPELDPWFIDRAHSYAAEPKGGPWRGGGGEMAAAPAMAMSMPMPQAKVAHAEAVVESAGAAVTYRITHPVAVRSDNSPHRTTIAMVELDARLDYLSIPKLVPEVYLRARVINRSRLLLLPGEASIFHGSDYIGQTRLETIAPEEEFELHLGVDERIRVERELRERTVSKGLIGNLKRTSYSYRIELINLLETPITLTLFDQLPLSRSEAVKVKLGDVSPRAIEESELGLLRWELELKSGEKREVNFGFAVEHQRDVDVEGME